MKNLDCAVVQDLLPCYAENLTSKHTSKLLASHLEHCPDCADMLARMQANITVEPVAAKPNKKILVYIYGIRLWYMLCPLMALLLLYNGFDFLLYLYKGVLILCSIVCLGSQFFSSLSYGFDIEQYKLQKQAEGRSRKQWGAFYTSPASLCLPALLTLLIFALPGLIRFILS